MPRSMPLTGLTMALVLTAGCAYKPKALPVREMSEYANATRHVSLSLAAEAFDKTTSQDVLQQPVNSKGYVPVLVTARNDGDSRVILDGARISLEDGTGRTLGRVGTETVARKCQKSVAAHVIIFGWLSGLGAADYNKKMADDWQSKTLPASVVLEPHSSTAGLLFYQCNNEASIHGGRLTVPVAASADADYEEVACVLP